jgi:hypothetical protein
MTTFETMQTAPLLPSTDKSSKTDCNPFKDCHHTSEEKEWGALLLRKRSDHTASTVCSETDSSDEDDVCSYTPKKNLRVEFAAAAKGYFIDSHLTYSEEERQNCWYSPEEKERTLTKLEKVVVVLTTSFSSAYRGNQPTVTG